MYAGVYVLYSYDNEFYYMKTSAIVSFYDIYIYVVCNLVIKKYINCCILLLGEDAIWHLLKVSAGLDSLVVGEGE